MNLLKTFLEAALARGGRSAHRKAPTWKKHRRLAVEHLEQRMMMSATVSPTYVDLSSLAPLAPAALSPSPPASSSEPGAPAVVDHPQAGASYINVNGPLFGPNGPSYLDVHQSDTLGDCWLMASLAEVAARCPQDITNMFTYLGKTVEDGFPVDIYSVRFYDSVGTPRSVIVDTELPAGGALYDRVQNGPLWAALAEKAYAQLNGQGYVDTWDTGDDSYAALDNSSHPGDHLHQGGDPSWALQAITGKPSTEFAVNPTNLQQAWSAGQFIVLDSSPSANDNLIVGDSNATHSYAVISYAAASAPSGSTAVDTVSLYNPWGKSSVLNSTVAYQGMQVFGGPCALPSDVVSADFNGLNLGSLTPTTSSILFPGNYLAPGQSLQSINGKFKLTMQTDHNLVLYAPWGPIWSSGQNLNRWGTNLNMQNDGNLVLYYGNTPAWCTGTNGPGRYLMLGDDGNLAVIDVSSGKTLWQTGTGWAGSVPAAAWSRLSPGQSLGPSGPALVSQNGCYLAWIVGNDLQIWSRVGGPWHAIWSLKQTIGKTGTSLIMQTNGNLVLYDSLGNAQWSTGTSLGGCYLELSDDGNLYVKRTSSDPNAWWPWYFWQLGPKGNGPTNTLFGGA